MASSSFSSGNSPGTLEKLLLIQTVHQCLLNPYQNVIIDTDEDKIGVSLSRVVEAMNTNPFFNENINMHTNNEEISSSSQNHTASIQDDFQSRKYPCFTLSQCGNILSAILTSQEIMIQRTDSDVLLFISPTTITSKIPALFKQYKDEMICAIKNDERQYNLKLQEIKRIEIGEMDAELFNPPLGSSCLEFEIHSPSYYEELSQTEASTIKVNPTQLHMTEAELYMRRKDRASTSSKMERIYENGNDKEIEIESIQENKNEIKITKNDNENENKMKIKNVHVEEDENKTEMDKNEDVKEIDKVEEIKVKNKNKKSDNLQQKLLKASSDTDDEEEEDDDDEDDDDYEDDPNATEEQPVINRNLKRSRKSNLPNLSRKRIRSTSITPGPSTPMNVAAVDKKWFSIVSPVISNIASHKSASFFANRVNENVAPDYYSLIYNPTDLRTIKASLKDGRIANSAQLEREICRMFANSLMYNRSDSDVAVWIREMQLETEALIAEFRDAEDATNPNR